jgi:uncharacterized OB-fold protein
MTNSTRPVPAPDERSAPYWEAAAAHQLVLARCSHCGTFAHPPELMCGHCQHPDAQFEFVPADGHGTVRSWTVMHQSFLPGFDADLPFVLVDVELDDQADLRTIGRLVDGPDAPLAIGARVHVAFEDLAPGISIPAFELESGR